MIVYGYWLLLIMIDFLLIIIDDYWWILMIILLWYISVVYINGGLEQINCRKRLENQCCYYKNYKMSGINSAKNYKYSILIKKYGVLKI